jgi:hypothetical protein
MLERMKRKDFYSFVVQLETPWKDKFQRNTKDLEQKLEKFKQDLFSNSSSELREQVIITYFNKYPFKSCKYDEIGKML